MKILMVASINSHGGQYAPFIVEQAQALQPQGVAIVWYGIVGHGVMGYLQNISPLIRVIRQTHPEIVHAHYGLSGLVACIAAKCTHTPIVVTYHGSDINVSSARYLSLLSMRLATWNIFVSQRNVALACQYIDHATNWSLLPCGIDLPHSVAGYPDMSSVLIPSMKHVLFAGAFDNAVKGAQLAKKIVEYHNRQISQEHPIQLVELKGYSREQVYGLMYACDAFLMTSKSEGSPQVIKEALACGLPIVSVDVGDVAERLEGVKGCYVASSRDPQELADLLSQAVSFGRTQGRQRIIELGLTNDQVAQRLMGIYRSILK